MGPLKPISRKSGAAYITTFTDDYLRLAIGIPIRDKTKVHVALGIFLNEARRLAGDENLKLIEIQTDRGTEYKT